MKISPLIQGLSIATVLLVAGSPAYGASLYIIPTGTQLDNAPILDIVGRPNGTINWSAFLDTTGLTANLQSITLFANADSNITQVKPNLPDDTTFFQHTSRQYSVDPNTDVTTILAFFSGPPGLPPNFNYKINDFTATLGSQLNYDEKADFTFGVLSAIDANGRDVTDQFGAPPPGKGFEGFVIRPAPVPEPSSIFGLVIAGGFGAFLKKQKK